MRVISVPTRPKKTGPKPPAWFYKYFFRQGTVVENDGVLWELIWTGAADSVWKQWIRH